MMSGDYGVSKSKSKCLGIPNGIPKTKNICIYTTRIWNISQKSTLMRTMMIHYLTLITIFWPCLSNIAFIQSTITICKRIGEGRMINLESKIAAITHSLRNNSFCKIKWSRKWITPTKRRPNQWIKLLFHLKIVNWAVAKAHFYLPRVKERIL